MRDDNKIKIKQYFLSTIKKFKHINFDSNNGFHRNDPQYRRISKMIKIINSRKCF